MAFITDDQPEAGEVLWALDLDERGDPAQAHRIVAMEAQAQGPEVRVTACGLRLDMFTHPRGWWRVKAGRMPLQDLYVHCGKD